MRAPRGIFAVVAAALLASFAAPIFAQQSDLDPLANKLAGRLKTQHARVIIAGFVDSMGTRSPLGVQLAGEFAFALNRILPSLEIVSKEEFQCVRKEELWSESDVRDFSVIRSLALQVGAQLLITGSYEREKKSLRLTVLAFDLRKDRQVARGSATVPLTPERARLDEQVLPLKRRDKPRAPSKLPSEYPAPVYQPGKDGVSLPTCARCPEPAYPREAIAEKYVGRVILRIVVTPEGRTADIRVERGAKYGLTEAAVKAVEKWKYKPARLNGKPVPVEVVVEVDFASR